MTDRNNSIAARAKAAAAKAAKVVSGVGSSHGSRGSRPERRQPTPPPTLHRRPEPEIPTESYKERDEIQEYDWQEQELRAASQSSYCFSVIDKNNLRSLLVPAGNSYPRLTQLFYQNMTRHIDEYSSVVTLTVSIDGWVDSFTKIDLAHALGIPASSYEASLPACPAYLLPSTDDCFQHLNELYPECNKGVVTRRTSMRQEMWLVDHFITKQLCPIGHKSERWAPLAHYLYCASSGFFLDAAELIFSTMWRVHCSESNKKQGPCPLPFMRYISTLLTQRGYPFRQGEIFYTDNPQFTAKLWKQSLKSCRNIVFIPHSDDDEDTVHMKWTKFYSALPHMTPDGFIPWVPRAHRPHVQHQIQHQAGDPGEQHSAQWDGIHMPTTRVRQSKKRRAESGEGTSSAGGAEDQASGTALEQILSGMQGLQIGFEAFSGQFGEVPLSQRMDNIAGRIENVETQFQQLRTDFTQYRELADQRYLDYQQFQQQQHTWQTDCQHQHELADQRYLEFQQFQQQQQTWQTDCQHQQEADFHQLNGNFYVTRHYEQQLLRQHMGDTELEEFNQSAEEMRNRQCHDQRYNYYHHDPPT